MDLLRFATGKSTISAIVSATEATSSTILTTYISNKAKVLISLFPGNFQMKT